MVIIQHALLNKLLKAVLQKILAQVPIAGPLLSEITGILWPALASPTKTSDDQSEQLQARINGIVRDAILQNNQNPFKTPMLISFRNEVKDDRHTSLTITACSDNIINIAAGSVYAFNGEALHGDMELVDFSYSVVPAPPEGRDDKVAI